MPFFEFSLDHWLVSSEFIPNVKFRFGPDVLLLPFFPHLPPIPNELSVLSTHIEWYVICCLVLVNDQCCTHFVLLVFLLLMWYLLLFLELTPVYSLYSSSCDKMDRFLLTSIRSDWLLTYGLPSSSRFLSGYFFKLVPVFCSLKAIVLNNYYCWYRKVHNLITIQISIEFCSYNLERLINICRFFKQFFYINLIEIKFIELNVA